MEFTYLEVVAAKCIECYGILFLTGKFENEYFMKERH